jgi:uncharacterized protein
MFESPLPLYEDARKAFLQERDLAGFVALERLPRIEKLANLTGHDPAAVRAEARLHFGRGSGGHRQITGIVSMQLPVTCQRCLEPVVIELRDDVALRVLLDEAEIADLEPEWDPWIEQDQRLLLAAIVEEQLMLSMPIVALHEAPACEVAAQPLATGAEPQELGQVDDSASNPFAVLAKLKGDSQEDP